MAYGTECEWHEGQDRAECAECENVADMLADRRHDMDREG